MDIDVGACLKKGVVGALGAIPGTASAHPFDVVKIRMQTTQCRLTPAMRHIYASGGGGAFYQGLGSALQQRVLTCGPMFLFSELFTQAAQQGPLGLARGDALFVGSAGSGYATGFVASIAEFRKVLISQGVRGSGSPAKYQSPKAFAAAAAAAAGGAGSGAGAGAAGGAGRRAAAKAAAAAARLPQFGPGRPWTYAAILSHAPRRGSHLLTRANGAGTRNAIFDSVFFGSQHALQVGVLLDSL
jgi:hypothetical protein